MAAGPSVTVEGENMLKSKLGSLFLVSALSLLVFAPGRVSARATVTDTNDMIPFEFDVDVPCTGDVVHVTGKLHFTVHTVETSSGYFQVHFSSSLTGSGVGDVTGNTYHVTLKNSEVRNDVPAGFEDSFIANNHVISEGSAPNLDAHSTIHFTLNANGVVTAQVSNLTFSCE
jgi:hypothetical protein